MLMTRKGPGDTETQSSSLSAIAALCAVFPVVQGNLHL